MSTASMPPLKEPQPEPTWDIARMFPNQGHWSEEEYLRFNGNRLLEFSHGYLEVLTMPTTSHQMIVLFLYKLLDAFATARRAGTTLVAPLRVRLWDGKYREPDVVFMSSEHQDRVREEFWEGADLVMEVVSDDDRRRDLDIKRREYAMAGIPEYWIVDPQRAAITVLILREKTYIEHGEFPSGATATSALLPGLEVNVAAALAGR